MEQISEQELQMVKSLDEWVEVSSIKSAYKNYKEFQNSNSEVIESIFLKNQVKDVHFRKKDTLNKIIQQDILRIIGFNAKNDEPVEVVLISK